MWFLMLIGVLFGLVVLLFISVAIRQHVKFYTKTTCSVCGKETGVKENCRYKLEDGFMCQPCAEKFIVNKDNLSSLGPDGFISETVESIRKQHQEREEMGEEAWQEWMAAKWQAKMLIQSSINATVRCPRCGSTQISSSQQGFGVGKAVIGAAVAGPVGLAAGGIGSKKVIVTCLKCGHQWQAGRG